MIKLEVYSYRGGSATPESPVTSLSDLFNALMDSPGAKGRISSNKHYATVTANGIDYVFEITGTEGSERFGG